MSNTNDFVIENGVLKEYTGKDAVVAIPEGVTSISHNVFTWNSTITSVTIPDTVTEIGEEAFNLCFGLTSVSIPDSVTRIGNRAFSECPELINITIPDSELIIGERAFYECKKIKSVIFSASVKEIGKHAFRNCKGLGKVTILGDSTKIGAEAFLHCSKIKTAGLHGSLKGRKSYNYNFVWTDVIPDNAFSGLGKLKTVVLPETIKSIGKNAFKGCSSLEEINLPENVTYDKKLFKDCVRLNVSENNTSIANGDFIIQNDILIEYMGNSSNVEIPNGITTIARRAFQWTTIESVTIPESVTIVEQEAFDYCNSLKTIIILGKIKKVGSDAFSSIYKYPELELYVYSIIPISAFSKGDQGVVTRVFSQRFTEFDPNSDVFQDNLIFLTKHLKQQKGAYSNECYYHYLIENKELRHVILDAKLIPAKDLDWLIEAVSSEENAECTAELLDYKNRLLSDKDTNKAYEKAKTRKEDKAMSMEMSVADWRKKLTFSYKDGYVIIKGVDMKDLIITVPDHIGTRPVRVIDSQAIMNYAKDPLPERKLYISEGIEEIRTNAFLCCRDVEVFLPSSLKEIPKYCFCAVTDLMLHIPASVTQIAEEIECDSISPFKAVYAPAGSYAEKYAKEHNIPFVAE